MNVGWCHAGDVKQIRNEPKMRANINFKISDMMRDFFDTENESYLSLYLLDDLRDYRTAHPYKFGVTLEWTYGKSNKAMILSSLTAKN